MSPAPGLSTENPSTGEGPRVVDLAQIDGQFRKSDAEVLDQAADGKTGSSAVGHGVAGLYRLAAVARGLPHHSP